MFFHQPGGRQKRRAFGDAVSFPVLEVQREFVFRRFGEDNHAIFLQGLDLVMRGSVRRRVEARVFGRVPEVTRVRDVGQGNRRFDDFRVVALRRLDSRRASGVKELGDMGRRVHVASVVVAERDIPGRSGPQT